MCLWCCWKDLDERDLIEFVLVRFGFRMWEILIFKRILPMKIQINSQKTRFWKAKSVSGHGDTWANGAGHTIKFI